MGFRVEVSGHRKGVNHGYTLNPEPSSTGIHRDVGLRFGGLGGALGRKSQGPRCKVSRLGFRVPGLGFFALTCS